MATVRHTTGHVAAAIVAGCLSSLESLSPTATDTPRTSGAQPSPTRALEIESVSDAYTKPLLDVATNGHEIVWSTGLNADLGAAPDVWHLVPGTAAPEVVFANPRRGSTVSPITVDQGRYAFIEANQILYGDNGYRLWFVAAPGARAVLIDKGDWRSGEPGLPLPRSLVSRRHPCQNGRAGGAEILIERAGIRTALTPARPR